MDDVRRLLVRVNRRLTELRTWLTHDHRDDGWWSERAITVKAAHDERARLRRLAHMLHVDRASSRGRIHCARFASLDEQRAWLAGLDDEWWPVTAQLVGLPANATLAKLRAGALGPI